MDRCDDNNRLGLANLRDSMRAAVDCHFHYADEYSVFWQESRRPNGAVDGGAEEVIDIVLSLGDCLEVLPTLKENSVDTIITDPPAGISFMGKKWDSDKGGVEEWIAWLSSVLAECRRVLKPGGALLCWSIPRTSHWTGMAIERAGYRIIDVVVHCHSQGFPKSLDISKKMDEMAGAEREVIGQKVYADGKSRTAGKNETMHDGYRRPWRDDDPQRGERLTAPATDEAKLWDGWHSSLAPAVEFWWLAYNPREGTYCQNALRYGVAGLNIDGARISAPDGVPIFNPSSTRRWSNDGTPEGLQNQRSGEISRNGRWPSDLILQHHPECAAINDDWQCYPSCPIRVIGEQSGERRSGGKPGAVYKTNNVGKIFPELNKTTSPAHSDTGTAARYFLNLPPDEPLIRYQAKPSKREKNEGLNGLDAKGKVYNGQSDAPAGCAPGSVEDKFSTQPQANSHPTTKSLELMRYFVKLTKTPTGGVVLDPFMGSGTTGVACVAESRDFIGIEMNEEYFEIAKARIEHEQSKPRQLELL